MDKVKTSSLVSFQGGDLVVNGVGLSILVGKYEGRAVVVLRDPRATWVLSPEEARRLAGGLDVAARECDAGRIGPAGGA